MVAFQSARTVDVETGRWNHAVLIERRPEACQTVAGTGIRRRLQVSFAANGWGLHDMHGNVHEWVADCWHENYVGAPVDGSAWNATELCGLRVLRGGSWNFNPGYLRSAARYGYGFGLRDDNVGFRVVRVLQRENDRPDKG